MQHILFLDIETVPKVWNFSELSEREQGLFKKKFKMDIDAWSIDPKADPSIDKFLNTLWREKAAFHAEFNKIVCVSIGKIFDTVARVKSGTDGPNSYSTLVPTVEQVAPSWGIKLKSFTSTFEIDILKDLEKTMASYSSLAAHYGKGFDFPILCRKYLMHKMKLPPLLDIGGKKPWEIPLIDTKEMWQFGAFKDSASLDLLANIFGLPSPKQGIDGSLVGQVYYEGTGELGMEDNGAVKKIAHYCEDDVITLINVYRCMTNHEPIAPENVIRV